MLNTFQIGGKDIEQRFQTINDGRDSILSLIDRQPSEDDLGLIGKFLLWADKTTANLQYKWAIYYIRKALSIEGEE